MVLPSEHEFDAHIIHEKIYELERQLSAVTTAWKLHHKLPRNSWGYLSNHEHMRGLKHALEIEIENWKIVQAHLLGTTETLFT